MCAGCGLENLSVRQTMLDLSLYGNAKYKEKLHQSVRDSLRALAVVCAAAVGAVSWFLLLYHC